MARVITLFFFSIHVLAVLREQGCTMTCCEAVFSWQRAAQSNTSDSQARGGQKESVLRASQQL